MDGTSPRTPGTTVAPPAPLASLLTELWRYKLVIPAVAGLVIAAATFYTLRQPKVYEANVTLEYNPAPAQPLGSAVEDTAAQQYNLWDTIEFYETQNFLLRSRSLAERVAGNLQLQSDPYFAPTQDGDGKPVPPPTLEAIAGALLHMVDVAQIRDTRIVRVSVRDHDPERAKLIANAWADAYIEKSLEDRLGASAQALEWLGSQMQNLKKDLEASEHALYNFRESHHSLSSSLEDRRNIIASQLQAYSSTLTDIRARRVQAAARLSVLREVLASTEDLLSLSVGPLGSDSTVTDLRGRYRSAKQELDNLLITYGEAHPQVRAARSAADSLLQQLQTHVNGIIAGLEAELLELERAEDGIRQAIDQINQEGLELSLQEIDYTRLDRERQSKSDLYGLVMQRAAQTDLTRALRVSTGRIVDRAVVPSDPVSSRVRLWVMVGAFAGIALGVLAALGVAFIDNKVRNPSDLEARSVTPLGVIPSVGDSQASAAPRSRRRQRRAENHERDLIVHLEPRSATAECCRTIRTNITFQSADHPLHAFAITSAMPREGKTTVATNLATTLAQSGRKVLLVDTDLRKPRLHRAFNVPAGAGVTSVLAGETSFDDAVQTTDVSNLKLLQCGPIPPNPSELLHTRRFAELIREAKSKFDVVVFDTPPLGAVTDPAIIAAQMDGTILVVRAGSTTRPQLDASLRQLRGVSARIVGAVLNDVDLSSSGYGSYYAYHRGYYAEDDGKATGSKSATSVEPT